MVIEKFEKLIEELENELFVLKSKRQDGNLVKRQLLQNMISEVIKLKREYEGFNEL